MPDEQITNAELARRLADLRTDLHDDLGDIKTQLAKLVPREVYDAQRAAAEGRVTGLEKQIEALQDRMSNTARWVISTVVIPVIVLVIQILLSIKGIK